jgi:hypothetical protein
MEEYFEGLHLIDFEQLKIENNVINNNNNNKQKTNFKLLTKI